MPTVAEKPRCTHREEQPIRSCVECGAYLRSFPNDPERCDPCSKGEIEPPTTDDLLDAVLDMDLYERRRVFEALA